MTDPCADLLVQAEQLLDQQIYWNRDPELCEVIRDLVADLRTLSQALKETGFCEAHQPPHGSCPCCEAVHADDERREVSQALHQAKEENEKLKELGRRTLPALEAIESLFNAQRRERVSLNPEWATIAERWRIFADQLSPASPARHEQDRTP